MSLSKKINKVNDYLSSNNTRDEHKPQFCIGGLEKTLPAYRRRPPYAISCCRKSPGRPDRRLSPEASYTPPRWRSKRPMRGDTPPGTPGPRRWSDGRAAPVVGRAEGRNFLQTDRLITHGSISKCIPYSIASVA